jgi:uncharacterized membrane protein
MTLAPLVDATPMIQIHTVLALMALVLTGAILVLRKGTTYHRFLGRIWVLMIGIVALSSFWINTLHWIGPFSPIHLLSLYVLYALVRGIMDARAGRIIAHKARMKGITYGGLLVAGAFTLLPGRIMHAVFSGG